MSISDALCQHQFSTQRVLIPRRPAPSFKATKTLRVPAWAQLGGGHRGRVPPTFSDSGDVICHVPRFLLFRFCNILVSHQAVPLTFYNKTALMGTRNLRGCNLPAQNSVTRALLFYPGMMTRNPGW